MNGYISPLAKPPKRRRGFLRAAVIGSAVFVLGLVGCSGVTKVEEATLESAARFRVERRYKVEGFSGEPQTESVTPFRNNSLEFLEVSAV